MGVLGAVACALCCVGSLAPVLVAGLVAVGLEAWAGSLDLVIGAGLVVFAALAWIGWTRMAQVPPLADVAPASTRSGQ